jgi:hypothetical protein
LIAVKLTAPAEVFAEAVATPVLSPVVRTRVAIERFERELYAALSADL